MIRRIDHVVAVVEDFERARRVWIESGCPVVWDGWIREEVEAGRTFLHRVGRGRRIIPIGRLAQAELGGRYVRHPSHGGAAEFRAALVQLLA